MLYEGLYIIGVDIIGTKLGNLFYEKYFYRILFSARECKSGFFFCKKQCCLLHVFILSLSFNVMLILDVILDKSLYYVLHGKNTNRLIGMVFLIREYCATYYSDMRFPLFEIGKNTS